MKFTIKELERVLVVARIFEHGLPQSEDPLEPHIVQVSNYRDDEVIFATPGFKHDLVIPEWQFRRGVSAIQIFDEAMKNKGD